MTLGLSAEDMKRYQETLITGYNLSVVVQILTLNHTYVGDVSDQLLDGQVNWQFWEAISSGATLTLLDPDNRVGFDTSSPADNALYADRMIRIVYSVYVPDLSRADKWVDCPIFCGPVTKVSRDDAVLSVECQGKESLVAEPNMAWTSKSYAKGTTRTAAIWDVMARAGETRFTLPTTSTRLPRSYSLKTESVTWDLARTFQGARSIRHLYYDGRGYLKFRPTPSTPVFTFTERHLLSVPQLDYNHGTIRNTVLVKGGTPEGKRQIQSKRYLPLTHSSSAKALGRVNSSGLTAYRHLVEVVEDSTLMTQKAADEEAEEALANLSLSRVGFQFDSFPIPHLETGDVFHLTTRDSSLTLRLNEHSIPLKAGAQSNGTVRKLAANRTRIRRR
jgi:hypothetical protein